MRLEFKDTLHGTSTEFCAKTQAPAWELVLSMVILTINKVFKKKEVSAIFVLFSIPFVSYGVKYDRVCPPY